MPITSADFLSIDELLDLRGTRASIRFRPGNRFRLARAIRSAPKIPIGTTGTIVEKYGHRAFLIAFDGDPREYSAMPECLARIGASATLQPAPSPFKFKARGSGADLGSANLAGANLSHFLDCTAERGL